MALTTWTYPPTQSISGSTKISDVDNKLTLGLGDFTAWINSTTPYIGAGLTHDYITNITTWNTQVQDTIAAIDDTYYNKVFLDAGQLDNRYFTEIECNTNFQVKGTYDITTYNSGATVIDDITVVDGAVDSITSRTLTLSDFGIVATVAELNGLQSQIAALIPMAIVVPIASNLSGSHTIPSSGSVDNKGWMHCNGAIIPTGNIVSGATPNLTDGRFLRGSSTSGWTGGSDTFTLSAAQLASHNHALDVHSHPTPSHSHSIPAHSHTATSNSTGVHTHPIKLGGGSSGPRDAISVDASRYDGHSYGPEATSSAGDHSHAITVASGGATTITGAAGSTGNAGSIATHSTGSGTAVTHLPKYMDIVYLIKVS